MNCFTAKACGRWLPLLSITLQDCTSFRHLPFHSVHCQPPASATRARVLPSFHCSQETRGFIPLPFGFSTPHSGTQSQNGKLHSTQSHSLHCIQSPPLLCPCQPTVCPARCSPLQTKNLKIPLHPLMVRIKIKAHSRMAFVLAASSSHSFNRSLGRSLIHFVHLASFSTPRVSVSCLTPTLFPTDGNGILN